MESKKNYTTKVESELNPLSLLFYLSCEQVVMLSFYLALDAVGGTNTEQPQSAEELSEFAAFIVYFAEDPTQAICYLLVGSALSLALAVLTFVLVNCTSPVATSSGVLRCATAGATLVIFLAI